MKKLLIFLTITLTLCCCNKNDDSTTPINPIDLLPPATQIGANTFGCLLDGEVFLPSGGNNPLDCVYQFVNGGYYFALQGNKRDSNNNLLRVSTGTLNLQLEEVETYQLLENQDGNATGRFSFNGVANYTSSSNTGEIKIVKLDTQNQIVSGTFWFDVEHPITGEIVQIREGRFDMQYTQ